MKTKLCLRGRWVPCTLVVLILLQVLYPSRTWTVLLFGLAGASALGFFWLKTLARSIHIRRETRLGWIRVGGQLDMRFTVSNISFLPAFWVLFKDHSTLEEYDATTGFSLGSGDFKQWNITIPCDRRGVFKFGEAELELGDPFGIFSLTILDTTQNTFMVLPQMIEPPSIQLQPAGTDGDGRPRPNLPEQLTVVSTVREYRPGDSTRLIHWPTSARFDKFYVRLMEGAPDGKWLILLDLDSRFMAGRGWDSIEEQSVSLAASLADKGLADNHSVGLVINGREFTWLAPDSSERQRWEILFSLAEARPGQLSLARVLERNRLAFERNTRLVVITASPRSDWIESVVPFRSHASAPAVFLFHRNSYGAGDPIHPNIWGLEKFGISCQIIQRGMLVPSAGTDQARTWSWRRTADGQAIPLQIPQRVSANSHRRT